MPQFLSQVVGQLPHGANLANLYLLPTSGGALYEWNASSYFSTTEDAWHKVYEDFIDARALDRIEAVIRAAAKETGIIDFSTPAHGERIEYRGAQITLSALGQQAPIEEKEAWDPSADKKRALRSAIAAELPEYDVKVGGSTSIDITKQGVNKAYGVRKLSAYLGVHCRDAVRGRCAFPGWQR